MERNEGELDKRIVLRNANGFLNEKKISDRTLDRKNTTKGDLCGYEREIYAYSIAHKRQAA